MALNLLSDEKETADAAAAKKSDAPAPVAFRPPVPEQTENVSVAKRDSSPSAPPVKKQPTSPSALKASPRPMKKGVGGFTKPEALTPGFGVNILGATTEGASHPPSFAFFMITIVGAFLGTAIIFGAWFIFLSGEEERVVAALDSGQTALATVKRAMAETQAERKSAEERLGTIETARALLAHHIYWTRFFHFLEAVTIPDIYYTNLAVDPTGSIRLAAVGRDFSAVARQLLAFEESPDVETARTTKAAAEMSGSVPGVQFDLALTVKPELLFFLENK